MFLIIYISDMQGLKASSKAFNSGSAPVQSIEPVQSIKGYFRTLVLVLGQARLGAQRWLTLGFFNLQPSEFGKLFITLA